MSNRFHQFQSSVFDEFDNEPEILTEYFDDDQYGDPTGGKC